jgi:beta-glucosidase
MSRDSDADGPDLAEADEIELPKGFLLGAATAAYQIEGAVAEGGKGESIWDRFVRTPGAIADGDSGEVACDHHHRWREDIALMGALGLGAYRFSISWPRIQPTGRGRPHPQGLGFYDRLVDGLLEAGITPFATLYHWDLPQALHDDFGGWLDRSIVEAFATYTDVVSRALGDRVKHWVTLNEPWTFTSCGYAYGEDAPGLSLGMKGLLAASHNALMAHGAAVPILRTNVADGQIGIVTDLNTVEPASETQADREAARRFDGAQNRWFLDPLFKGAYPTDMVELYRDILPEIRPGDTAAMAPELDFLGVNYYRRSVVRAGADLPPVDYQRVSPPSHYTAMGWEVHGPGLYDILHTVHEHYGPKALYVTENGAAFDDVLDPDGRVRDRHRTRYLLDHLREVARAAADGLPLKGYFAWSLMDNFEWAYGFAKRFGLVHVDYPTQRRTIKDSGRVFAHIARPGGPRSPR